MDSILFNSQTLNTRFPKFIKFPSLKKITTFSVPRRKIPYFILSCSSLKPRPKLIVETPKPELLNLRDQISSITTNIHKLVILKKFKEALELFEIWQSTTSGSSCDDQILPFSTYDSLITACISVRSSRDAKFIFRHMIDNEFEFDQYFRNRILLMHLKCGMIFEARQLFDEMPERNVVSWNIIISGLLDLGSFEEAFDMFFIMWDEFSSELDSRSLMNGFRAASGMNSSVIGKQLHSVSFKLGIYNNNFILCALIDMYSKCDCLKEARWVFDEIQDKSVVAWNSIIAGYALHGYSEEALDLYYEMQRCGVKLDHFTYSIVIRICAQLGSLEHAKQIHAGLVRHGFGMDLVANTSLIDIYCKWGRMEDARNVFDKMKRRNLISWNALINGYAVQGMGEQAVSMLNNMVSEGLVPNHVTYLAVLNACIYSGSYNKGREIFELMSSDPRSRPRAMHYASMIELLGREGQLDEALSLIKNAPFPPTKNMWAALLTACRVHGNLELGKFAAERLFGLEPEKLGNYIVLLNIYNSSGRTTEAAKVLEALEKRGLRLVPACSWIEIKKRTYKFMFGDKSHPRSDEIYKKLDELMEEIEKLGYIHGAKCFLPDIDKEENKSSGCHSEKLAIAFGLISTSSSICLQVVQGHRVCDDCHGVIKMIAKVTKREIVLRDANRFHHFRHGSCSCGDYW